MKKKDKKAAWTKLSKMLAHYNKWARIFGIEEIWYNAETRSLSGDCEISRKVLARKETVFTIIRGIIGFEYLNRLHRKIAWYTWELTRGEDSNRI